jgi:hypothetical protein
MATVKILYDSEATHLEEYLKRHQDKDTPTTEHSCSLEGVAKEFASLQRDYQSKGNNSIHLIQSWSPTESKSLTKDQVHAMGIELATRFAPGHQFVVQTHDDQPHLHNHIMINPVSLETGKRIQNKLENIRTVRNLNDDIARERGLSVLPPQEKLTRSGPNEHVKRIEAYRGRSYILDLARKSQFARAHATNYDEYIAILNTFDINARVEPKNIVYFYPGRSPGKRGKNLDPDLDKPGLEKRFAKNLERAKTNPEFKKVLGDILNRSPDLAAKMSDRSLDVSLISQRREEVHTIPRAKVLEDCLIPIEALQAAKTMSITEYCARNKIKLGNASDGKTVISGKENIEVSPHSWINHKNQTRGNVIDFVANHQQVSLLHAVSILTNNPRLLLLEQHAGKESSRYRPFFIPEKDSASRVEGVAALSRFVGRPYARDEFADLFKQQRVHVASSGIIRFLSERDYSQYTQYIPDPSGSYQQKRTGSNAAFHSRLKKTGEIELYPDPRSYLIHSAEKQSKGRGESIGVLALLEPSIEAVHRNIAAHSNLSRVTLVGASELEAKTVLSGFFEELKETLNPFSIDVRLAWEPISLSQSLRSVEAGNVSGRSREISF